MKPTKWTLSLLLPLSLLWQGCGGGGPSAPPPPAATADAAVQQVVDSLNRNDPSGLWHMLPGSYQNEANTLFREMARDFDPEVWTAAASVVQKLHRALDRQKNLILSSPMLQGQADLAQNYDHFVAILGVMAESDLLDQRKMQQVDLGQVLGTTGRRAMELATRVDTRMIPGIQEARTVQDQLRGIQTQLISEEGDRAVVAITVPGEGTEEVPFVRVEGKWIPEDIALDWQEMIAEAREGLAAMSQIPPQDKAEMLRFANRINGLLDQLIAARNQQDLQAVMGGAMGMMMGM